MKEAPSPRFRLFWLWLCEAVFLVETLAGFFALGWGEHRYQLWGITLRISDPPKLFTVAAGAFVVRSLFADHAFWLFRLLAWPLRQPLIWLGLKNRDGLRLADGLRLGLALGILVGVMAAIQYRYVQYRYDQYLHQLSFFSLSAGIVALAGVLGLVGGGIWLLLSHQMLRLFTSRAERISLAVTLAVTVQLLIVYFQRMESWGTEPILQQLSLAVGISAGLSLLLFRVLGSLLRRRRVAGALVIIFAGAIGFLALELRARAERSRRVEEAEKPHRRILLITIDTLRADHVGCYGYSRPTTPNLDQLAGRGIRFSQAYCTMPTTDPSHLSLLTGFYPRTLGVPTNGPPIGKPDLPSLPEFFQQKGFATAAIVSRAYLDPSSLELRGFDEESAPSPRLKEARAEETFRRAANWLSEHYHQDFFLWVHFFDPHGRYDPPARWAKKFITRYEGAHSSRTWIKDNQFYSAEQIAYRVALYDGEIAYTDHTLGRLLDFLHRDLLKDNREPPLILVTADHGEMLGELQYRFGYAFGHGEFLYHSQVHVPLILSWPGRVPSGRIIEGQVDQVDLAPTLVELVFPGESYPCQGVSFARGLTGTEPWPRTTSFAQRRMWMNPPQSFLRGEQYMVLENGVKLIYGSDGGRELYDLSADPGETTNLAEKRPGEVESRLQSGHRWESLTPYTPPRYEMIDRGRAETLRNLGYVQ